MKVPRNRHGRVTRAPQSLVAPAFGRSVGHRRSGHVPTSTFDVCGERFGQTRVRPESDAGVREPPPRPSLEETREPAILERPAAGLTRGAVVDRVLLEVDARERRAAALARLAELVVHAVGL